MIVEKQYILILSFFFILRPYSFSQTIDRDDCYINSIHCWEKVYISGGIYNCSDWEVVLDENFDQLDTTKWKRYYGGGDRTHIPCSETLFLDENVEVKENTCILYGRHQPNTSWQDINGVEYIRDFTGATLESKHGFHFGRYEATISKMPERGWWPAFWMWHHEEIDIMEWFGEENSYFYNSIPSNICDDGNQAIVQSGLYSGTHTFAVDWTPLQLVFYYNNKELPTVVYRFYHLDGTPLKVNCGDEIPQGTYYLNPNFPLPYRIWDATFIEGTWLRPMVGIGVLPRGGLTCCGVNNYCYKETCDMPCSDWGNPIDQNGNRRPGTALNTKMVIDNINVQKRDYSACEAIVVKMEDYLHVGHSDTIIIESIGDKSAIHVVDIVSVKSSPNIEIISQNSHTVELEALEEGDGHIEIKFIDDCGSMIEIYKKINVYLSQILSIDPCNNVSQHECCPDNTLLLDGNCFYADIPQGYSPRVEDYTFYVAPDCNINMDNNCCPPGYMLKGSLCHSGISYSPLYEGFITNNKYVTKPNCGDDKSVWLYPNPASEFIYIDFLHFLPDDVFVRIFDSLGRLHRTRNFKHIHDSKLQLNVADMQPGLYFMLIEAGEVMEIISFIKK